MKALILLLGLLPTLAGAQIKPEDTAPEALLPEELLRNSDVSDHIAEIPPDVLKQIAFEALLQKKFALTPEQIRIIEQMEREKTEATKRQKPAKAINEIIPVDLRPNTKPPIVFVTPGWDTHIRFIDASGNPWPIIYQSGGSQEDFPTQEITPPNETTQINAIKVNSTYRKGSTNLTVMLKDLNELITVVLQADDEKYHPAPSLQLAQYGPNTTEIPRGGIPEIAYNDEMKNVLYGGVGLPTTFQRLESSSQNVEAWLDDNSGLLFVRTDLTLVTPHPVGIQHGTGGYKAYRTNYLPVLIFNNDNGVESTVMLTEVH